MDQDMDQNSWKERVQEDAKNMHRADGIASSQTVLGGNILRTTVIFGANTPTTRTNPAQQERGTPSDARTQSRISNDQLRTMSFLGKNEQTGKYDLVFMTPQGGMHTFSGDYDASERRVVFTSKDSMQGMQDGARSERQQNDRREGDRERDDQSNMQDSGGIAVVLEMQNDGSYTLTAYRGSASMDKRQKDREAELGGQPADRQGQGQGGEDQRSADVIYRATYTKADERMRSQFDRMIQEQEGMQSDRDSQSPGRR